MIKYTYNQKEKVESCQAQNDVRRYGEANTEKRHLEKIYIQYLTKVDGKIVGSFFRRGSYPIASVRL